MSNFTHIAGTFLIQADGSFLNGAGLGDGEDNNTTIPKTMIQSGYRIPYVSAQAWRRWLRNTAIEEANWRPSILKAIDVNNRGNTSKIAGELNPVDCPEDDIFGYMRSIEKDIKKKLVDAKKELKKIEKANDEENIDIIKKALQNKIAYYEKVVEYEEETKDKVKALIRTSPLRTSILMGVKKKETKSTDKGFVHLQEGTPQPYNTQFYSTNLQGIFCLDYSRLGVFQNCGDRVELDQLKIFELMNEGKIEEIENHSFGGNGTVYKIKNLEDVRRRRTAELLSALSVLSGGAKQSVFGTDVAPKMMVFAALDCGNPIFNHLFKEENILEFKTKSFIEIVNDYKERIIGKVYIGIRNGYLANEQEVYDLTNHNDLKDRLMITTPLEAVKMFIKNELGLVTE